MSADVRVVMRPGWVDAVKIACTPGMHRVVDAVERNVRVNQTRHVRTGAMFSTIRSVKMFNGGRVYVGTDHWPFVEYGTRPRIIRPRRKKALYWHGARHPVKKVFHPGTREYAPMRKALKAVRIF